MVSPCQYTYNLKSRIVMKIELNISKQSKDACMNHCPKGTQNDCGIMYRAY